MKKFKFYEFFAGGGMARLGLGDEWECLFANDFSPQKAESYRRNFDGAPELHVGDVFDIDLLDLPKGADLAWASFPCQDLSLAGNGHGLEGQHSAAFFGFWDLMAKLAASKRPVPVVVLENVVGTISARDGKDFEILLTALTDAGYQFGPLVMNAIQFIPQSRPRLFIVGVHESAGIPPNLVKQTPDGLWHPSQLIRAYAKLPVELQNRWVWWEMPYPAPRKERLIDLLLPDDDATVEWHSAAETARLVELMSSRHKRALEKAIQSGRKSVGTIYRRIRTIDGVKRQYAELRMDDVSGCLRTGSGGSSKQFLIIIEGVNVRSRRLAAREAARLMGLPDTYVLPPKYGDAYHLLGDGLVVPVVEWLGRNIVVPLVTIDEGRQGLYRAEVGSRQFALLERSRPLLV